MLVGVGAGGGTAPVASLAPVESVPAPAPLRPPVPLVPPDAGAAGAATGVGAVSTLCVPVNEASTMPGGSFALMLPRICDQATSCAYTEVTSPFSAAADVPPVCGPCCS